MNKKLVLAAPCLALLVACGGSGDGSAANPTVSAPVGGNSDSGGSNFENLGVQGANLIADYGSAPATSVSSLPTGSHTYTGVAGFNFGNVSLDYIAANAEALGTVTLEANFQNDSISGTLTNFVDYTNTRGAGQVDLRNGVISGNEFTADITGTATYNGTPLVIQGGLDGAFVGNNADAIIARADGTWGGDRFSGLVGAEKQ